jgi:hypothetical protein
MRTLDEFVLAFMAAAHGIFTMEVESDWYYGYRIE